MQRRGKRRLSEKGLTEPSLGTDNVSIHGGIKGNVRELDEKVSEKV